MNETDKEIIDRLLTEHGTSGLAQLIAEVCRERAATLEAREEGSVPLWKSAAKFYAEI